MILDLRTLFENPNQEKVVKDSFPIGDLSWGGQFPFSGNASVEGIITNKAGIVEYSYSFSFRIDAVCDRCAERFTSDEIYDFSHILVQKAENDDENDLIVLEDSKLVVDELAISDLLLNLPMQFLCKEDCAGVCPYCGANRNINPCSCTGPKKGNQIRITYKSKH